MPREPYSRRSAGQNQPTLLHSVLYSRRCRKTSLSGEDVWPVHLEAALLEGLESYLPDQSRETQVLGRFRGRNRFISNYIFNKTGERRTNKQVGSRLQQLRHCSTDPKLRRLLLPPSHEGSPFASRNLMLDESPGLSPELANTPRTIPIPIPILPPGSPSNESTQQSYETSKLSSPRPLDCILPTVTFVSPRPMIAQSYFSVWYGEDCVHTETAPLIVLMDKPAYGMAGYLHSSVLVPAFWRTIVASPDPTKFVIAQDVVKDKEMTVAFSAEYRFVY